MLRMIIGISYFMIYVLLSSCSPTKRQQEGQSALLKLQQITDSFAPQGNDLQGELRESQDSLTYEIVNKSFAFNKREAQINISLMILKLHASCIRCCRYGYNLVHSYNNATTRLIVNQAMKIVSYDSTFVSGNGFYTTHFYKRILLNKKLLRCERIKKQVEIIKDTKYLY